jgi:iron complex outermembrane receptor protein
MTAKKLFLFWILLLCQLVCAQQDSIVKLKEVVVSDVYLKNFSNTQSVRVLNDSVIQKNAASLTSLLNFNSTIYFKENGLGMVSSPSFRGTTAQQTAVIWNGININSQLNGQTDFNTIPTKGFDNITVRAGGGSSIYGSSAMGGSIHLNNELVFKNQFQNDLFISYGSFNTFGTNYKVNVANEKTATQLSISRNSSSNDYEYLGFNHRKNENGQFYNTALNASFGYKMNKFNSIKFYSQFYDGERHFSLFSSTETRTKYKDFNTRNLLEWEATHAAITSNLKIAFLSEEYKYFANIDYDDFTFGKVSTFIAKYSISYHWNDKMALHTIVDFNENKGYGSSISKVKRTIASGSLLFTHELTTIFNYEISLRKEETSSYKSPVLFSVGTNLAPVSYYNLKFNFSRNYRIPTYNDLYWEQLGNPNLKAESSYQSEISNVFIFKKWSISGTVYHSKISDMIRWIPKGGGIINPENTAKVSIFGFESALDWETNLHQHQFKCSATYAYTQSEDEATNKQLIYVPFHKMTAGIAYSFHRFSANYQYLYNGKVYTQSDNNPSNIVDWYVVSNVDLAYTLGNISKYSIGFKVLNLWNEKYQSVENRPLPGRNFNLYLTFKF